MGLGLITAARTNKGPCTAAWVDLEFAAWKIALLGSCHLGKYLWEVAAYNKIIKT